jgi:hypothetical protein
MSDEIKTSLRQLMKPKPKVSKSVKLWYAWMGRKGGSVCSEKKAIAVRKNGLLGGDNRKGKKNENQSGSV